MQAQLHDEREKSANLAAELAAEREINANLMAELAAERSHRTKDELQNRATTVAANKETLHTTNESAAACHGHPITPVTGTADDQTGERRRQQQESTALTNVDYGTAVVACAVSPCELTGVCLHDGACSTADDVEQAKTFTCECTPGHTGGRCEVDIDECTSTPCENDGHCTEGIVDTYTCECAGTGYEGANCVVDADECTSYHDGACTESTADAMVDVGTYYQLCGGLLWVQL